MKHTMKKLLIPFLLLISTLGFSQGETKIPLLQLYQSGATTGQVPKWDGTKWAASDDAGVLSGTTGRIATFTSGTAIGNSLIYQDANWQSLDYTAAATKNLILTQGNTAPAGANVGRYNVGFCIGCYTSTGMLANTDENVAVGYANFTALKGGDYNVAIGSAALQYVTSASGNMAIGYQALKNDTSGSSNVAVGNSALRLLTNGGANVGIGTSAGDGITTGSQNVLISSTAGRYLTTGTGNVGIGYQSVNGVFDATIGASGYTTGGYNTAIGYNSLRRLGNGNYIVAIGPSSGWYTASTAASGSIAIGSEAGFYFDKNYIAIGYQALRGTSAAWAPGNYNLAIGYQSSYVMTSGNYNTAIGPYTLFSDTSGVENVAIGFEAGYSLRSAGRTVNIGAGAGRANLTGQIVAIGGDALRASTGTGLTAIGSGAGQGITSGDNSIAIGKSAMGYGAMTGSSNIAIGNEAMSEKTSGTGTIGIGHRAGFKWTSTTGNTAIGSESFSTAITSTGLTGIGYRTGLYATGSDNTFIGYLSGQGISGTPLTGSNNTAIGSQSMALIRGAAANNGAIGAQALYNMTTGARNYAFGTSALYALTTGGENMAIGHSSLLAITDGAGNAALGDISMYQATGNSSYNVAIGKNSLNGAFNFQHNTALGYLAGSLTSAGRTGGVYIGSGAGYGSTVNGALYIDKNTTPTSNKAPLIGGVFSSLWVGINTLPENLSASLEITSASNTFSTKTLEFNNSSATNILDLRDNGNMGMSITAQSANKLAVQQSASGTQVAVLIKNGVDEDGQGIALDLNNAGIVHGRIVATNPTGSLTSALDLMTPDNSGTLSSFVTMQRDGSQLQLHKALYKDIYSATSATETLTGLISVVNVPTTSSTTTINLPEIVTGVPASNQVNVGYVLDLVIDNAAAVTIQRSGSSDVIIVDLGVSTVTSFASTGGVYLCKKLIAVESNKWVVF